MHRLPALPMIAVIFAVIFAVFAATPATAGMSTRRVQLKDIASGALLIPAANEPGVYLEAPMIETKVDVKVSGLVTRTTVRQRFKNDTADVIEATYVFPLSETAAVDELKMIVGKRVIEGKIEEKKQAEKIFEDAKREGKSASLVEQVRPNLFTNKLANIPPNETIEVVIGISDTLRYEAGHVTLRHPLAITPRYTPSGTEPVPVSTASPGAVDINVVVEAGFPVARVDAPYHRVGVANIDARSFVVALSKGAVPADKDFVVEWNALPMTAPTGAVFLEEHGSASYALLMLVPPTVEESADKVRTPRETIFILDTSGSMSGPSMDQAKRALSLAVQRIDPRDAFNVVEFDDDSHALWSAPRPATRENREEAMRFVDALQADGGTEMLGALEIAFKQIGASERKERVKQVVFITDGAVSNEAQLYTLIEKNVGKTRLFTVGIGSAPNTYFMRKAAEMGRGTFTYVGAPEEVDTKMGDLFAKIESPVLSNIEIDFGQGSRQEVWPQKIPDVYLGEPLMIVAKTQQLPGVVEVTGLSAGAPWKMRFDVPYPIEHAGVHKLWARKKVDSLTDAMRTGLRTGVEKEILAVALEHHIVSEFTSLVAVDVTPVKDRDVAALLPAQNGMLPRGGTSSRAEILFGLMILGIAVAMLRRVA